MPNGKTHGKAEVIVLTTGTIASLAFIPQNAMPIIAGLALGCIANCDVRDQTVRNYGEHRVDRILGKIVGGLWTAFWYPLAALVNHRSALSHAPFVSTAVAIAYMFWIPVILWPHVGIYLYYIYMGLLAQDLVHWGMDQWWPKKRSKRG